MIIHGKALWQVKILKHKVIYSQIKYKNAVVTTMSNV